MPPSAWWDGRSGLRYTFELYPLGTTEFLPNPGVYVLGRLVKLPNGADFVEALYVGETKSFYQRLNTEAVNHDGYKRACASSATHIAVLLCRDPAERLRIETDLRHSLDPVCNRESVPDGRNAVLDALLRR